mmetsp:Transcript_46384/g.113089  ORF Transcript_46384/g.113089 Transcript_46384/m.113089 type:complete len:85 (+) Transcript_46384:780-1034(+)
MNAFSADEKQQMKDRQYKRLMRQFLAVLNGYDLGIVKRRGLDGQDKVPLSLWPSILKRTTRTPFSVKRRVYILIIVSRSIYHVE